MAASFWPKQSHATVALAIDAFVTWVIQTAGLWIIHEAYSSAAALNKRRVPGAGEEEDLDSATFSAGGDFSWQTGTLALGDWIVLESRAAGTKCQVYIEYNGTTSIGWVMLPLADFKTVDDGAVAASPPVSPNGFTDTAVGSSIGGAAGVISQVPQNAAMDYSAVCDDSTIIFWCDDGDGTLGNREWMYVGAYTGHPDDTRPFIINDLPSRVYTDDSTSRWNRIGWVSNTLGDLIGTDLVIQYPSSQELMDLASQDGLNAEWILMPYTIWSARAQVSSWIGVLKYTYYCHQDLADSGTFEGLDYVFLGSDANRPKVAFDWDGSTAYSADLNAYFLTTAAVLGATVDKDADDDPLAEAWGTIKADTILRSKRVSPVVPAEKTVTLE